jgi:hypothetical protein
VVNHRAGNDPSAADLNIMQFPDNRTAPLPR